MLLPVAARSCQERIGVPARDPAEHQAVVPQAEGAGHRGNQSIYSRRAVLDRIHAEAGARFDTEEPIQEKGTERIEAHAAKTQASMARYFETFETGTLRPVLSDEKVRDPRVRPESGAVVPRFSTPTEMLEPTVEHFMRLIAIAPARQQKHLLHRPVKKVPVDARLTTEVRYPYQTPTIRTP